MLYQWGDSRPYNSYSGFFKRTFGERVQKLSIDAGFSCPNRDGSIAHGGCTFCNNKAFNPSYCSPEKSVTQQLSEGLDFHKRRYSKTSKFLAYFQAFSNTYKPLDELCRIYDEALSFEEVVGIVVGTRPDCVDEQKLDYFEKLSEKHFVALEYGVESCDDSVLREINRGHDFEKSVWAIEETAKRGIHVGAHFILGLPSQSREEMIDQTHIINSLPLNTIKFHQLQIFKDTVMARQYADDPSQFNLFDMEEYLDFFIEILIRLRRNIVVERFISEAPPRLQAVSRWGLIRNEQLLQMFEKRLLDRGLSQGCLLP